MGTAAVVTTRVYLVRHGETDDNANGRAQGHRDVPLNDRGRAQAAVLAAHFAAIPLGAVWSSDASRAVDTVRAIAAGHSLVVHTDVRLRELDQGHLDGMTSEQMRQAEPELLRRWREDDPADLRMPGGETLREAQRRMVHVVEEIARIHPETDVVIASHNLATRALLCHALDIPLASFRRFRHDLGAIAMVEVRLDAPWTVDRLNERCHQDGSPLA